MERRKTIFEWSIERDFKKTVPEMIAWLQQFVEESECDASEVLVEISQGGDQWDGYDIAEFTIDRPMTAQEIEVEDRKHAEWVRARDRAVENEERRQLTRLLSKYGTPHRAPKESK